MILFYVTFVLIGVKTFEYISLFNNKVHKKYPLTCWKLQIKSRNHYTNVIKTAVTHTEVLKVCNDNYLQLVQAFASNDLCAAPLHWLSSEPRFGCVCEVTSEPYLWHLHGARYIYIYIHVVRSMTRIPGICKRKLCCTSQKNALWNGLKLCYWPVTCVSSVDNSW